MNTIYNISIWFYIIAIQIAALFNHKAKLWITTRKDLFKKLSKTLKNNNKIVWVHCSSLGEFEQGKPIIKSYKSKNPDHQILLTFFSPSGFEIRKKTSVANWVFCLPADTKSNAKRFIQLVSPIKVIFIKYEFWFNYMSELHKNNIPFYSVSTVFRDGQHFFKYKWFANQLKHVTHFFVQDENSAQLLKKIGCNNYTISGDTRFDTALANKIKAKNMPIINMFSKGKKCIICGSTWPKDEKILIKYIKNNPEKKYIIAPHELTNISNLKKQTNALLYSNTNEGNILTSNVLIIDNIGMLSNIYKYGDIAYIGGGFGAGIHNILEAVAFGLPVIFGPNYYKHNEAISLIQEKGAISISNYTQLRLAIDSLNTFDNSIALNYIKKNAGATQKILATQIINSSVF